MRRAGTVDPTYQERRERPQAGPYPQSYSALVSRLSSSLAHQGARNDLRNLRVSRFCHVPLVDEDRVPDLVEHSGKIVHVIDPAHPGPLPEGLIHYVKKRARRSRCPKLPARPPGPLPLLPRQMLLREHRRLPEKDGPEPKPLSESLHDVDILDVHLYSRTSERVGRTTVVAPKPRGGRAAVSCHQCGGELIERQPLDH